MPYRDVYFLSNLLTSFTSGTPQLQMATGATCPLLILDTTVTQINSTTSTQMQVGWQRFSAACSNGTAATLGGATGTVQQASVNGAAPLLQLGAALTCWQPPTVGTAGAKLPPVGFNILNGLMQAAIPESRVHVPAASFIVLQFYGTVPSAQFVVSCTVMELG